MLDFHRKKWCLIGLIIVAVIFGLQTGLSPNLCPPAAIGVNGFGEKDLWNHFKDYEELAKKEKVRLYWEQQKKALISRRR